MLNRQQQYGQQSEQVAAAYLKKQGYKILARNFRTGPGEIDIIARQGPTIVFVEVKARQRDYFGRPRESITPAKQKKLTQVALCYLKQTQQMDVSARFDVVEVEGHRQAVSIIPNAFEAAWPG